MLLSDGWLEEFQQCIIRKHNGHTLRWRYDYSHTPRPCRHLVTASLCFRGLFFWDALYTRNRDSERSMINATILERRFERRLQTRFDYGYWNVILLLEKVINAPHVSESNLRGELRGSKATERGRVSQGRENVEPEKTQFLIHIFGAKITSIMISSK